MSALNRYLFCLTALFAASTALGATEKKIALTGTQYIHEMSFSGLKSSTLYRTEEYEGTCEREVPETVYHYECDTRTVNHCTTVPGSESCSSHPSCTEVTRQVCSGNHGCQDVSTHECTNEESCHTSAPYESCTSEEEQYNCGDRAHTEYRTETYSCTKTHEVAVGTEVDEELTADVILQFTGDFTGVTGKDTFLVSIANGLDLTRKDVEIELIHSEDTHFLKLKTLFYEKTSPGPKRSHLRVTFQVEVIPVSNALVLKTKIKDLDATRGALELELAGAPVDENVNIEFTAKKDRVLGGLVLDHTQTVNGAKLSPTPISGGERVTIPFNLGQGVDSQEARSCLKKRPYVFNVKLIRLVSKAFTDGLMNPNAVKKISDSLTSTLEKRVKLSGSRHPQCDSVH